MTRAVVAIGGALAVLALAVRRFRVEGRSMLPLYQPGDRLVALPRLGRRPHRGDVVVVSQPGAGRRIDLKRVGATPGDEVSIQGSRAILGPDEWWVVGDNLGESTDSRQLGPVRTRDIAGFVWFKY